MPDLKRKQDILEKAKYRYYYPRLVYFNPEDKKIFCLQDIENNNADWLEKLINKKKETDDWEIYFANTPPSEKIQNQIISEIPK